MFNKEQAAKHLVMVVDDNQPNVDVLVKTLQVFGFKNTVGITDPRTVLELYRTHKPTILFIDCHMPFMGGIEVLTQMVQEPGFSENTRVIMLTGDVDSDVEDTARSLGAMAVIIKPYMMADLIRTVQEAMG